MATSFAFGQSFGRFGFSSPPVVPGMTLDKSGIRAAYSRADWLRFRSPVSDCKLLEASEYSATYYLGGKAGSPIKLRINLLAPGIELYVTSGLTILIGSTRAPYLTWNEGSVAEGIPTPVTKWVGISFADVQPPWMVAAPGRSLSLKVTGKPGAWILSTSKEFKGWIRFALPAGIRPSSSNSAAELGSLAAQISRHGAFWTSPSPVVKKLEIRNAPDSLIAVWTFDRSGACVPPPLLLARNGGYEVGLLSGVSLVDAPLGDGPAAYCKEPKLAVKFPWRRIPEGRAVTVGPPTLANPASVSPFDPPSVSELASTLLFGFADPFSFGLAQQATDQVLTNSNPLYAAILGQRVPFDGLGNGLELCAAHALLESCQLKATSNLEKPNAMLTSLRWALDWRSWSIDCTEPGKAIRANVLASCAGGLSNSMSDQLLGCRIQAGLASRRYLSTWLKVNGLADLAKVPVMNSFLRPALFDFDDKPLAWALNSPLRVLGDQAISARVETNGIILSWERSDEPLLFKCNQNLELKPVSHLKRLAINRAFGAWVVLYEPEGEGPCEALVVKGPHELPASPVIPRFQ